MADRYEIDHMASDGEPEPLEGEAEDSGIGLPSDSEASFGEKAGRVAMSTMLAASLSAVLAEPPRTDMMTLPDPTPIVQVVEEEEEEESVEEDAEEQERESRLERILRILRFLAIALAIVLAIVLAVTRGCASCAAPLLTQNEQQEQAEGQQEQQEQAEEQAEQQEQAEGQDQLDEAA